ncbi:MAG: chemotaxis protein CheX [Planctomycetes bacterium]|nr:chemotaxis protein CheX [Planctomycetota bacterium]
MATQTLEPHLIDSLQQSAREILETMVAMIPQTISAEPEDHSRFSDPVIGLLGFTGTRSGTFVVRTHEQLARTIAAKMLMMEPSELGSFGEAVDAFGEVVNMLAGNFKNAWVAEGNQMDLSVPNVIHNGEVSVQSAGDGCLRSRVRVQLDGGALDIGVHFEAKD